MKKGNKLSMASLIFYVLGALLAVGAITGFTMFAINYYRMIGEYINQGYAKAEVEKVLFPQQYLPEIFKLIMNMGIPALLVGVGIAIQKITNILGIFTMDEEDFAFEDEMQEDGEIEEITGDEAVEAVNEQEETEEK